MKRFLMIALALMIAAAPASAVMVQIDCNAEVEFSQINFGELADIVPGDAVLVQFLVDSDNYMDQDGIGVRSYPIVPGSWEITIGSVGPVAMVEPQPFGRTPYFNLRESDPVADGFFVDCNTQYDVWPVQFEIPARIDPNFGLKWTIGYVGTTFDSLDILEGLGTYDFDGLTSFYCGLQDAGNDAMGFIPINTVITTDVVAVENSSWGDIKSMFR